MMTGICAVEELSRAEALVACGFFHQLFTRSRHCAFAVGGRLRPFGSGVVFAFTFAEMQFDGFASVGDTLCLLNKCNGVGRLDQPLVRHRCPFLGGLGLAETILNMVMSHARLSARRIVLAVEAAPKKAQDVEPSVRPLPSRGHRLAGLPQLHHVHRAGPVTRAGTGL